jgi:hypothetical protein
LTRLPYICLIFASLSIALFIMTPRAARANSLGGFPSHRSLLYASSPITTFLPFVGISGSAIPRTTTSRYEGTLNATTLYNQGCHAGTANQTGVFVLDYGSPRIQSATYGTRQFGTGSFISTTQIADATKSWLQGYWNCSPSGASIIAAIGTTNCGYISGQSGCKANSTNITREHGQAWEQMVKGVNDWIITSSYSSKLSVAGANDIELSWSGPAETRAWVDGFFANAPSELFALYNYGACDGCPYLSSQNWVLPNGWTNDDVWYVSWGAWTTYMLPEIYLTNGWNANQWYLMSLWSFNHRGGNIHFKGAFTQWQACQDVGGCTGTNNTPSAGWLQLSNAINADSRTAQPLLLSTDITWQP